MQYFFHFLMIMSAINLVWTKLMSLNLNRYVFSAIYLLIIKTMQLGSQMPKYSKYRLESVVKRKVGLNT